MTWIGLALVLFGLFAFLTCVVGLYRLDCPMNRMHAAALGDALGAFSIFAGLILLRGISATGCKLLLILLLLWMTGPVASHLLAEMEQLTNSGKNPDKEVEQR